MKSKWILLFLYLAATAFQKATAQAKHTKHALIFAIGNYPEKGGWDVLASNRDAVYIKKALVKQGFSANNIHTYTDGAVTPQGISTALARLIDKVNPGDIVVIHFSTHGEQIFDNNADEADGKDESIVTYHAVAPTLSKNFNTDQAAYFRDDQFGSYIKQLRRQLGKSGDVVVFMDLCHSGTGTRGTATVRGGQPPFMPEGYRYSGKTATDVFREKNSQGVDERSLATYVVFSAAEAGEISTEIKDEENKEIGPLSYALLKTFKNLDAGTTYRSFFAKIQTVMNEKASSQHPVMEGNGIDRMLFGGKFVQQKPYIEVEKTGGKLMSLKSGNMAGLNPGATVVVCASGTISPVQGKVMATGMVTEANDFTATVTLNKEPSIKEPASLWVFITKPVYPVKPVRLKIGPFPNSDQVKQVLAGNRLVTFEGEPELVLVKGNTDDTLKIASNGKVFTSIKNAASPTGDLNKSIRRYALYKYLQALEINDREAKVDVKLVPIVKGKPDKSKINAKIINGTYAYNEGDQFVVWVKNTGKVPVYFNMIDIQPDGIIHPLFPRKEKEIYPEDLQIMPGASKFYDKYAITVYPPYGMEVLKIFASRKVMDMEKMVGLWNETTRGSDGILEVEDLTERWFETDTNRGTGAKDNKGGSIGSIMFQIKPRK